MAKACVRRVHGLNFEIPRALGTLKKTKSQRTLRSEVDIRRVAWRYVRRGEQNAAGDERVRIDLAAAREIPLENYRLETCAIDRTAGLHYEIERHEFGGEFEIAARPAVEMVGGDDFPDAATGDEELRAVGVAKSGPATNEGLQLPGSARERLRRRSLRGGGCRCQEEQDRTTNTFHLRITFPTSRIAFKTGPSSRRRAIG